MVGCDVEPDDGAALVVEASDYVDELLLVEEAGHIGEEGVEHGLLLLHHRHIAVLGDVELLWGFLPLDDDTSLFGVDIDIAFREWQVCIRLTWVVNGGYWLLLGGFLGHGFVVLGGRDGVALVGLDVGDGQAVVAGVFLGLDAVVLGTFARSLSRVASSA